MKGESVIYLLRTGVGERLRGTRLDVLPAVSDADEDQVWIGDGDSGHVLLKLPAAHLEELIASLRQAQAILAEKPPRAEWYGGYELLRKIMPREAT